MTITIAKRLAAIALIACSAAVADDGGALVHGRVAGPRACASEPHATYAYYLPSAYSPARRWPVLFVFDPRSRGAFAAELFREAAEDYGWIVVSSNDTMSDTDPGPSVRAINAMAVDVPKVFAVDPLRMYATGFSGGAMYAWALAKSASFAGVIGCSGRPITPRDAEGVKFDWYGTAGTLDFNDSETRAIEKSLERAPVSRRFESFAGSHRWAPVPVLRHAVEWMELQAMRRGTRPRDNGLIERLLREDLERAAAEPDVLEMQRHYDAIARSFDGIADAGQARAKAAALRDTPDYARLVKEERDADAFEQRYRTRMMTVFRDLTSRSADAPSAPWLAHALDIAQLQRIAREPNRRGTAAARVLETMYSNLHFYLARDFRASGEGSLLNIVLTVASQIHPEPATQQSPR